MFIKIKDTVINSNVIALVEANEHNLVPLCGIIVRSVANVRLRDSYLDITDDTYTFTYDSVKERNDDLQRITELLLNKPE